MAATAVRPAVTAEPSRQAAQWQALRDEGRGRVRARFTTPIAALWVSHPTGEKRSAPGALHRRLRGAGGGFFGFAVAGVPFRHAGRVARWR